jgi:hypothetical protein
MGKVQLACSIKVAHHQVGRFLLKPDIPQELSHGSTNNKQRYESGPPASGSSNFRIAIPWHPTRTVNTFKKTKNGKYNTIQYNSPHHVVHSVDWTVLVWSYINPSFPISVTWPSTSYH